MNAASEIAIKDTIDTGNNKYVGYKLDSTDPETVPAKGTVVISGSVIKVYYVKDDSQTQNTKYTVHYTINGVEQENAKVEVTGTAWVNDNPAQIAIAEGGIPAPADKYTGYKLDPANPEYPEAGTLVNSGSEYTVNYIPNGDTAYTVEYYYQQPTGDYKLEATDNRTGTTDALATLLSSDKQVNITTSSAYSWNAEDTVDNQPISGDGNTTLKVYFDLGYQVVYFYRASEENEYTQLESSGYIYQENNRILKPNVLFDGQWVTSSSALTWDFDNFTVNDHKNCCGQAFL